MIMDNNQLNLEMGIVDLGVGNGNNRHQLQHLEFAGIMALEDIHMEFRHYVGWISACYFADIKKDKLIVGLKYHKYQRLL